MKRIECSVVRDILPLYLDDVVSQETRDIVKEHLTDCPDCREQAWSMKEALKVPGAPDFQKEEAGVLKRHLKRMQAWQLIQCVLVLVLTFAVMAGLYASEFYIDADSTAGLEAMLEQQPFLREHSLDVLETVKNKNRLYVYFRVTDDSGISGVAWLEKGIFGKYRLLDYEHGNEANLYHVYWDEVGGKQYWLIATLYDLPGVEYFEIVAEVPGSAVAANPVAAYSGEAIAGPRLVVVEKTAPVESDWFDVVFYDKQGQPVPRKSLIPLVTSGELEEQGLSFFGGLHYTPTSTLYWIELGILAIGLVSVRLIVGPLPRRRKAQWRQWWRKISGKRTLPVLALVFLTALCLMSLPEGKEQLFHQFKAEEWWYYNGTAIQYTGPDCPGEPGGRHTVEGLTREEQDRIFAALEALTYEGLTAKQDFSAHRDASYRLLRLMGTKSAYDIVVMKSGLNHFLYADAQDGTHIQLGNYEPLLQVLEEIFWANVQAKP